MVLSTSGSLLVSGRARVTDPNPEMQPEIIEGASAARDASRDADALESAATAASSFRGGAAVLADGAAEAGYVTPEGAPYHPDGEVKAIGAADEAPIGVSSSSDNEDQSSS